MALWQFIIAILFVNHGAIGLTNDTDLELTLLHVVFRHGEKVPQKSYQSYPNDPHANYSYYPIDDGDMTNAGKYRMYKIGVKLRETYGKFLGKYYLPSLIYARSTDVPRTQMSLQLVLAGLFPPIDKQIWNPLLSWQPVSEFSKPSVHDTLFFPSKCSKNYAATKAALMTDGAKNILAKYKDNMEYIANYSGKPIRTLFDVLVLYNLFDEQIEQNLTLPNWTEKIYPKLMRDMATANLNLRSHTKDLRRYNGGFLLYEITKNIQEHSQNQLQPANKKAFIYSGHEFNIIALARTLGLQEPIYPNFGTTFIIETLQDKNQNYYVKIILWPGTDDQVVQSIPNCENPCPLEQFLKIYNDVIPTTEEVEECEREVLSSTRSIL